MSAGPVVRSLAQVPGTPLGPGVTVAEMLSDEHGCRGLHQRRLDVHRRGAARGDRGRAG